MIALVRTVWRWRRLVIELARRDVRTRYAGSSLGLAWALLEPAIQFGLYFVVFAYFIGMRLEGSSAVGSFGMYLVSGLLPFLAFQECVARATGLARMQAALVRHVNVPLEVLLVAACLSVFVRHGIGLGIVFVVGAASGSLVWAHLPLLVAALLILAVGIVGLGLALEVAGAFVPDVHQVVATGTMVLFYLTPIVYPLARLPARLRTWLVFNPLVGVTQAVQSFFVPVAVDFKALAISLASAALAVALGVSLFSRRAAAVRDLV